MSMEIHVFFHGTLPGTAALTRALKDLGFAISIAPPHYSLEGKRGYRPMRFRGYDTGVEFYIDDGRNVIEDGLAPEIITKIDPLFDRCASFRWGGAEDEMMCGVCCAAALATLVNGVVYEEQDGELWSIDQSVNEARKIFESTAKRLEVKRGTRTADIKQYLKSLLKERSDLALVGRDLLIRPVRHLIRGALLDRTSNKYRFNVYRYIAPLHHAHSLEFSVELRNPDFYVWQPHFEPLLIDRLRDEVFEQLGQVTTLEGFVDSIAEQPIRPRNRFPEVVTCLVLAGARDRAAEVVRMIGNDDRYDLEDTRERVRERWEFLSRDIETVCAHYHAKEAEIVKEMKLEHIWEPSPFPVERPIGQRAGRTAEPIFSTSPWSDPPPTLFQELPEKAGEIRFANGTFDRNNSVVLLAPIARDEAEERHRNLQAYVLAAALSEDVTLVLKHESDWHRNDPEPWPYYRNGPPIDIFVELHSPSLIIVGHAHQDSDNRGVFHLQSVRIRERGANESIWYLYVHEDHISVCDLRRGTEVYSDLLLTASARQLLTCETPGFGEYADLVARIHTLLQHAGYPDNSRNDASRPGRFRNLLGRLWRAGRDSNP